MDQKPIGENHEGLIESKRGFPALKHYNYRVFAAGQAISLIGTWMQSMAQSWLVLELSDSALILGLVGTLQFLPMLLFSLVAGVLIDRFPKRRILIFTQAASGLLALTLGVITFTGVVQVWHVMVLAFLLGMINSFDMPTRQAFVVEMVGRDDILNAVALNSSVFNAARIFGPAVAGVLIAQVGIAVCFLLNGVSYIAVLVGLLLMDVKRFYPVERGKDLSMWEGLREGVGYVRRTRVVALAIVMIGVVSLFAMNFNTLNPLFARDILNVDAQGFGLLMSAMGIGALISAVSVAAFIRKPSRKLILLCVLALAVFELVYSFSNQLILSCVLMGLVGMSATAFMANSNSLIQTSTPDRLRGRVMSVYTMVFGGVSPFGAFYTGLLAEHFGPPFTMLVSALIVGLGGIGLFLTGWHRDPAVALSIVQLEDQAEDKPDQ